MAKIYIVTNCAAEHNYTPSVFEREEDAIKWLYELGLKNVLDAWNDEIQDAFNAELKSAARDVLHEITNWLEEYDATAIELLEERLSDKANAIVEKFNIKMSENKIPYRLSTGLSVDDIECEFYNISHDALEVYEISEGNEKEYLEFFKSNCAACCDIKISDKAIDIYYSDDSYNNLELFEVTVIGEK